MARSTTGDGLLPSVLVAEAHLAIVAIAKMAVVGFTDVSANAMTTTIRNSTPHSSRLFAAAAVGVVEERSVERWLGPRPAAQGLVAPTLGPASADASFRRYRRIDPPAGAGRIVMDAPPDKEDCRAFVHVAGLMAQAGLHVPAILAWDEPQGFMLLEDVGRHTMMDVIQREDPQANQGLYLRAVDALIAWQLASKPAVLPAFDQALLALALIPI